jgi:hypothetical protein
VLNDLDAVHRLNPEAEPLALVPLPDNPKEQVRYEHLLMLELKMGPDCAFSPRALRANIRFRNSSAVFVARPARAGNSWGSKSWEINTMYPGK